MWAKILSLELYMVCLGNNEWTRWLKIEITKWQHTPQIQPEFIYIYNTHICNIYNMSAVTFLYSVGIYRYIYVYIYL